MKKSTLTDLVLELEAQTGSHFLLKQIIEMAKAGEFHDYKSAHFDPKGSLIVLLKSAGLHDLAIRVFQGEFDEDPDAEDLENHRRITPRALWKDKGLE